jgi:hypothetical protein
MPNEVMWVNEITQIGPQNSGLGNPVAATKKVQAAMFEDEPKANIYGFGPDGEKYDELEEPGTEWSELKISGPPTFDELTYLLDSMWGQATPTIPGGGTNSRQRIYTPGLSGPYNPLPLTVERGSAARARKYTDVTTTGLTFTLNPSQHTMAGDAFGQPVQDAITLTPGLSGVPLVPILAKYAKIFVDPTAGAIGTTKMSRAFNLTWGWTGGYEKVFTIDSDVQPGWATITDLKPNTESKLTLESDAQGLANLPIMRAGSYQYMRVIFTGPVIESTIHYLFQIDCAIKVSAPSKYQNKDGTTTNEWTYKIVKDPAWNSGQAFQVTLVNTLASV